MAISHTVEGLDRRGAHIFEACCVAAQEVAIEFDAHLIFDRFDWALSKDSTEFGLYYESGRAVLRPDTDDSLMQVGLVYMSDHDLGVELQCYAIAQAQSSYSGTLKPQLDALGSTLATIDDDVSAVRGDLSQAAAGLSGASPTFASASAGAGAVMRVICQASHSKYSAPAHFSIS